jgi:exonuclease VII small subunit
VVTRKKFKERIKDLEMEVKRLEQAKERLEEANKRLLEELEAEKEKGKQGRDKIQEWLSDERVDEIQPYLNKGIK